jgi:hypothetical protein
MAGGSEIPDSRRNFILQQGLDTPAQESCPARFSALMFQPRLVGSFTLLAVILQSPAIFLVLSGILWWNAFLPRRNPFDAVYNRTLARRPGAVRLEPSPPPRRSSNPGHRRRPRVRPVALSPGILFGDFTLSPLPLLLPYRSARSNVQ